MGKYGTNLEGFGAFEGGVNADKGAPLVSTSSDGATALLFGPAALREIQAGVANGDFAIPPDEATSNITDENPLPYWTSAADAGITISVIDASEFSGGSLNGLRFTVAPSTPQDREATIYRYVPIAANYNRAFSYYPEVMLALAGSSTCGISIGINWYDNNFTLISSGGGFTSTTISAGLLTPPSPAVTQAAPANAAYAYFYITVRVNAVGGSGLLQQLITVADVRLSRGDSTLLVSEQTTPSTYAPTLIQQKSGVLAITPATSVQINGTLIGDGVTTDLKHGITLQRTTNLTVNTSVDASATAITWSSAVKNTSLYSYWSSGSTISIPLTGWYSITCHLISGTGLGTGFAFRLYALVNGTVIAESETQAGANTTSDTFAISTIAYMTAADSLVFRASASAASKTIGGARRSACSVVYLGNTSA